MASKSNKAIPLYVHQEIPGEATTVISTPHEITINGIKFWSATPIHITPVEPTTIQSSAPASSFVTGWNNLPLELKIEVLSHNLVATKPLGVNDCTGSHIAPVTQNLYHHLRSTPEIAALATEIFYRLACYCTPSES
ncbi:hypothetical protein P280DRAFT_534640 [Massarina eburnea CBS 473.64]|uniref:Uncharacterized protein n=1 Tax=Massarina eburnea CBS 473.64 TaxID=1395130 RepID=A0A6A6RNN6_9PLEO|nr:hypothetical protein P280DRAFT_534640 [Massarina eburnea CBS 473.64]